MNPQFVPIHRNESLREEGMLFVRTDGILETMVKAPLVIAGLLVVALSMPMQSSFGSTRSLDLIIYPDGSTHVSAQIDVDPLNPEFELELYGPSVDNFVAVGESGFLLSSEFVEDKAILDTYDSSFITVNYDVHDLVSKEGRVWTFSFDSPVDYSLTMPDNSVIVGMNVLPDNMDIVNDKTKLELYSGFTKIDYIFGTPVPTPPTDSGNKETVIENDLDLSTTAIIAAPIAGGAAAAAVLLKRKQSKKSEIPAQTITNEISTSNMNKVEKIFSLRPDMREDDKEIVKFISENGGEAFESELRKKFLQPRTTMWRAVKRLERLGVVEITKKDTQNLVKLRDELEEEQ